LKACYNEFAHMDITHKITYHHMLPILVNFRKLHTADQQFEKETV